MSECCFPGCNKGAEFQIIDQADGRLDASFVQACEEHVGVLLGHATDLPPAAPNVWTVWLLSSEATS